MKNIEFKYLKISESDTDFGLWVSTVGFQSIHPDAQYPLTSHPSGYYFNPSKGRCLNEYQLVFISKGEGSFTSEHYNHMKVRQGKLMMLFPGQWHTYSPSKEKGWDEYYIGFNGPIIETLIARVPLVQENQILDIGLNEELETLFRRALDESQKDKQLNQQYLVGIVMHMLGLILSVSFNQTNKDEINQKIEIAISSMKRHIETDIDVMQLADELTMSYSYFRKSFKKYTGYSPNQYFQNLKIHRAKELLYGTSDSVKEISYKLDYGTPEYFTNLFKKRVGKTPLEYRQYVKKNKE